MFDFASIEGKRNFIQNTESGIYEGKNVDGEKVIVRLEKGVGMDILTQKHSKPKWYEVVEANADGEQISLSYEPVE